MIKRFLLIFIILVFLFNNKSFCQDIDKFNLDYIASDYIDTVDKKSVIVVLAATPINKKDFPPVLSLKFTYKVNDEPTMVIPDIMNQKEKKLSLIICGNEVSERYPPVYRLVKDKIDLNTNRRVMLLAFRLENISENPIEHITITYGLWEKRNQNKRKEKVFEFNIND